jgi:hypothetical protein
MYSIDFGDSRAIKTKSNERKNEKSDSLKAKSAKKNSYSKNNPLYEGSKMAKGLHPKKKSLKTERGVKRKSILKNTSKTKDERISDSQHQVHFKSSKTLKKPYDRLGGKDYANYLSISHRDSNLPQNESEVSQQDYVSVGPSRNNLQVETISTHSACHKDSIKTSPKIRIKNGKNYMFGKTKFSKETMLQTSHQNMLRNFSPVLDRKLLLDLRYNCSSKNKDFSYQVKNKKKTIRSQKDYLNKNIQNVKSKKATKLVYHKDSIKEVNENKSFKLSMYNPRRNSSKRKGTEIHNDSDFEDQVSDSANMSNLNHINSSDDNWSSPMYASIDSHYKSNDDVQKPISINLTKEDPSFHFPSNSQALRKELLSLREHNNSLMMENQSLRQILRDFELMKEKETSMLEEIEMLRENNYLLEKELNKANEFARIQEATILSLQKEKQTLVLGRVKLENEFEKEKNNAELTINHFETKNRLLIEALNKRNEDVKALENGNEDLINLLEKCDDKIQKLDEDYKVEKMKTEKYEEELDRIGKGEFKIDVETLDGRINFLVNTLEEYRKILEEDSEFNNEKPNDDDISRDAGDLNGEIFTPSKYSSKSESYIIHNTDSRSLEKASALSSKDQDN